MTNTSDIRKLNKLLRLGRYDYDHVAGRVYAACYNDPYVLEKILAAEPEDVPSSEVEGQSSDHETSEDDAEDGDNATEETQLVKQTGSKEDPVLLDGNIGNSDKGNNVGKRKRTASQVNNELAEKKAKHPNALLLCLHCGGRFNPDKNREGACRYHPGPSALGELEMNPTDDQITDDEDSRETWPNAFQWECCETNLEEDEPCETGQHIAEGGERTEYSERQEKERRRRKYFG